MNTELLLLTGSLLIVLLYRLYRIGSRDSTLPPGPPTVPLLGNIHMFPTRSIHLKFSEWARQYGDFYSLKIGPQTFIILSSAKAVKEFLDMRGPSTSDRLAAYIPEQVHEGNSLVFGRYGERWKLMRKTVHAILTPTSVEETYPIQFAESVQLLHDLLHDPKSHFQHVRRLSASIVFSVLYGKRVPRYESYDSDATSIFDLLHSEEHLFLPGAQLPVDIFPFLKYLPEGPLAPWKKKCKDLKGLHQNVYFASLQQCKDRIDRGESVGCFMEQVLERYQKEFGLTWQEVGYIGGTLLQGGIDTSASLLQLLIMMLSCNSEIQRKAQEEIDRVIGHDRIPQRDDIKNLPYIQAIIKEVCRFSPPIPFGVPHATIRDEEYRGYIVPKGSAVFQNQWGILHDPETFENPDQFWPDRYLLTKYGTKPGVDDSSFRDNIIFGAGRRICPGIQTANLSLTINVTNLLWAFTYSKAKDPLTGFEIPIDPSKMANGFVLSPLPFECSIQPRNQKIAGLIHDHFVDAIDVFKQYEGALQQEDKEHVAQVRSHLV
ncbi:cytochrome P450 [Dendrothele bispora CBS 962.96]|uniref:Cytochrome P450 n=1 Tax=Dendrothele bispora (strain CBS 962.96) TaxID=1314807 RepID=A0A4S8MV28_DENBC|nr:cytochrome P450 [Dendrothele bispora CBS 962.96]